jgi:D-alanyl-D-alanine carboxypeptidase
MKLHRLPALLAFLSVASLTLTNPSLAQGAATTTPTAAVPAYAAPAAALTSVIDAAARNGFEGVVLVTDIDRVIFERTAGLADRQSGRAHGSSDVWRWASVTKQVATIIAAQLIDEGRLALDNNVASYLGTEALNGDSATRITIRQLLQHTSGLANPNDAPPTNPATTTQIQRPLAASGVTAATPPSANLSATKGLCAAPPKRPPGERMEYNNCDYLVLGAIIEKITGLSFSAVVNQRIAQPLGLAKWGGVETVKGYVDGKSSEAPVRLAGYGAAGAATGSPRDLAALDRALLGDKLLSPAMKAIFWKGEPAYGYAALGVWAFSAPIAGCTQPLALVERRGAIGAVQVRNVLIPAMNKALIVFTNRGDVAFGEIWQGSGLTHDLLSAALCR